MKFPSDAPVTSAKLKALKERMAVLKIALRDIHEKFIRAGGPGGQKVNKTSSGVQLQYQPQKLNVKWTRGRSRALNRFLALRELVDKLEYKISPETSLRLQKNVRIQKQKKRRKRRNAEE